MVRRCEGSARPGRCTGGGWSPGDEVGQEVSVATAAVEPAIEVGLGGGGQGGVVFVEPGQKVQGEGDLAAGVGGGTVGDRAVSGAAAGSP